MFKYVLAGLLLAVAVPSSAKDILTYPIQCVEGPCTPPPCPTVPEPATWALMLTGFGLVGYSMRKANYKVA